MIATARKTWRDSVRRYAILMIGTVGVLAVVILGIVVVDRIQTQRTLQVQDDYHLTSALRATASQLEIEMLLESVGLLERRIGAGGTVPRTGDRIVSDVRSSLFILRDEIAGILDLQAAFADPEFDDLTSRLMQHNAVLAEVSIGADTDAAQLTALTAQLVGLKRTLDQIGRMHVIRHDQLRAEQIDRTRRSLLLLVTVVVIAAALAFAAIRRGLSAISDLTTEQQHVADALRASELRFRAYAASSADRYWQTDAQHRWRWIGVEPVAGDTATSTAAADPLDHGEAFGAVDALRSYLSARRPFRNVEVDEDSDRGRTRWWRISGVPTFGDADEFLGFRGVATDITEQKYLADQSRQLQRIDAIGRLTGGVAHDFNNILAAILGNLEILRDRHTERESATLIRNALSATMRGGDLTKSLLSFAGRAPLAPRRVDLNHLVRDTTSWSARVLPETIRVETSLLNGLWGVDLDPTSMESALLNLSLNARDAMPEGGKLTIETANVQIDDDDALDWMDDLEPGRYVMLAVSDSGHGIAAEDIDRIYEPFFTTKAQGEGAGLGLSMVQGFAKQSGGAIRVYSEIGHGTTFKLYFKAASGAGERPASPDDEPARYSDSDARVLLVEDDPEVRAVLVLILEKARYAVTAVSNADAALQALDRSGPFDVLVTDIVMPGKLQGPALARAVRSEAPGTPCIFLSGYANEAAVNGTELGPVDVRLMKPVRRADLLRAVSKAIESTT